MGIYYVISTILGETPAAHRYNSVDFCLSCSCSQADCSRYVTDYANAAENSKLCTEAETKKLFDWLRKLVKIFG